MKSSLPRIPIPMGAGNNTIWIDPEHDLVIVWRWHAGNPSEFFKRVVESIRL